MNDPVIVPFWLAVAVSLLASWALLERLLVPGVRWFFRRRLNLAIDELNQRLDLRLPAFKVTRRKILIEQLTYDPQVLAAVEAYCAEEGIPHKVAMDKAERYAREIVPSFNAYLYFRFGNWLARSAARFLYRVRMVYSDEAGIQAIAPDSSVVFVMNHRSNMDYILLAYMAVNRSALSYAVGEWARVWPVQQLIRSLGAYFVRRNSGNKLYRRVLARYVQKATQARVVQAVFPEGGLSRDGKPGEPKIGLLDYMLRAFKPAGNSDLVFIPVAVNYDRVLEDRSLLMDYRAGDQRPTRRQIIGNTLGFIGRNIGLMLRGGWYRFGYAAVNFGTPISMTQYAAQNGADFTGSPREKRVELVKQLADEIMEAVGGIVPVLPASLIAWILAEEEGKTLSELDIKTRAYQLMDKLENAGAHVHIPRGDRSYTIRVGLRMLVLRHIVEEDDLLYRVVPAESKILRYYADSIAHLID